MAVDLSAGQLFQQLGAFFRFGIEKCGELPLRQQHRTGKTTVIQPGKLGGHLQLVFDFIGEDFAVGAAGQLYARDLQVALRLIARPVLAPESAIGFAPNLKLNFGQTLGGVAGHQVVLRL